MRRRNARWAVIGVAAVLHASTSLLFGSYIPVISGPAGPADVTGWSQTGLLEMPGTPLAPGGIAIGFGERQDAGGTDGGSRAFRWGSEGVAALSPLGTDPSGYTTSQAFAINEAGIAVGYAEKYEGASDVGPRAVRWDGSTSTATELGALGTTAAGYTESYAYALNAGGTTVGVANRYDPSGNSLGTRAVRWDPSGTTATELASLGADASGVTHAKAVVVNKNNAAAGTADLYGAQGENLGQHAVRWSASGVVATALDAVDTDAAGASIANVFAMNDAGTIVGSAAKYDASGNSRGTVAVRWAAGGSAATALGDLGVSSQGYSFSEAFSVNAAGTAVGYANRFDGGLTSKGTRAVRWDASGTTATELGLLGADLNGRANSIAYAINSAGIAVGYAEKFDAGGNLLGERAVYWAADGKAVDLNTLIDPGGGWTLNRASAITDDGWIAGIGTFDGDGPGGQPGYRELFLIQLPEPASGGTIALLIAFGGLASRHRSRRAGASQS